MVSTLYSHNHDDGDDGGQDDGDDGGLDWLLKS